ncbi:hypothetical protein WICPIJ_005176, partial [Wickerhamomyces pijperi]
YVLHQIFKTTEECNTGNNRPRNTDTQTFVHVPRWEPQRPYNDTLWLFQSQASDNVRDNVTLIQRFHSVDREHKDP